MSDTVYLVHGCTNKKKGGAGGGRDENVRIFTEGGNKLDSIRKSESSSLKPK